MKVLPNFRGDEGVSAVEHVGQGRSDAVGGWRTGPALKGGQDMQRGLKAPAVLPQPREFEEGGE